MERIEPVYRGGARHAPVGAFCFRPHGHAARLARHGFCFDQERSSVSLSAEGLVNPELIDREPLPCEITDKSATNGPIRIAHVQREPGDRHRADGGLIECHETGAHLVDVLGAWCEIALNEQSRTLIRVHYRQPVLLDIAP